MSVASSFVSRTTQRPAVRRASTATRASSRDIWSEVHMPLLQRRLDEMLTQQDSRSSDGSVSSRASSQSGASDHVAPSSYCNDVHLWPRTSPPSLHGGTSSAASNADNWRSQYAQWAERYAQPPDLPLSYTARGKLPSRRVSSTAAQRCQPVPFGLKPTAYKVIDGKLVPMHVDSAKQSRDAVPQTEEDLMDKADEIDEWHRQQWGRLEGESHDA